MRKTTVDGHTRELAYMVRDNAVHGWRTIEEIAKDEGLTVDELQRACLAVLDSWELEEVYDFSDAPEVEDAEEALDRAAYLYNAAHFPKEQAEYEEAWRARLEAAEEVARSQC